MDLVAEDLGDIASFTNPVCRNVSVQESSRAPTEGGRGSGRGHGGRDGRGGRGVLKPNSGKIRQTDCRAEI